MPDPARLLSRLLDTAGRLYSLPAVALNVLRLTADPQVDAQRLRGAIEYDPALAAKILRVVNSSLFGLSQPVTDLGQAIALLGLKPLKLLVLGFCLPDRLFAQLAGDLLTGYWRRALTKAVAARELARWSPRVSGDEAFVAGLLQDLGQLVLLQQIGEPYVKFLRNLGNEPRGLLVYERTVLGFDHTELSARLLTQWGLPALLVEAVANRPLVADASGHESEALRRVVELASLVSELLVDLRTETLEPLVGWGQTWLGISRDDLLALIGQVQRQAGELARVLSVELPADWDATALVVEAHGQLALVSAEVAGELVTRRPSVPVAADVESATATLLDELAAAVQCREKIANPPAREPIAVGAPTALPEKRAGEPATRRAVATATDSPAAAGGTSPLDASPAPPVDDPLVRSRVQLAVQACRQRRRPLSLWCVAIDRYAELVFHLGLAGAEQVTQRVESLLDQLDHPGLSYSPAQEARWVVLVPDCDRRQAVELGQQLVLAAQRAGELPDGGGLSLSVGAATVAALPKNFPADELLTSADRCLYAAQASGGGVKSIEIY